MSRRFTARPVHTLYVLRIGSQVHLFVQVYVTLGISSGEYQTLTSEVQTHTNLCDLVADRVSLAVRNGTLQLSVGDNKYECTIGAWGLDTGDVYIGTIPGK